MIFSRFGAFDKLTLHSSSRHTQYRTELRDCVVPFWSKYGLDWQSGGICTCISDDGRVLNGDKSI
jgi:mannose/cellobiose epimerase-like protein (N-acyl-D-glucosamine 2-epimerase family)